MIALPRIITDVSGTYIWDPVRDKILSISKEYMIFVGRDNTNNSNEYARVATFTSNQAGNRLIYKATLVGISAQTNGVETWVARVRKNGAAINIASLSLVAVAGSQNSTLDINFDQGDSVEVFIDGTGINRPVVKLEFAYRLEP